VPRPYATADRDFLSTHGLAATPGLEILVNENGGVITGALSYAHQSFESGELGINVAQIEQCLFFGKHAAGLEELLHHCQSTLRATGVHLVTSRQREENRPVLAALHHCGFRVIECLLTLGRTLPSTASALPAVVEIATPGDAEACGQIAAASFSFDRFHADPKIDTGAADNLKAAWARNSCLGRADIVFVMRESGTVIGFNACRKFADTVEIDLIGVSPQMRGCGIGRRLVDAALAHYAGQAARITVGTQSANIASLALYQSAGFKIEASAFTLHKHLGAPTP